MKKIDKKPAVSKDNWRGSKYRNVIKEFLSLIITLFRSFHRKNCRNQLDFIKSWFPVLYKNLWQETRFYIFNSSAIFSNNKKNSDPFIIYIRFRIDEKKTIWFHFSYKINCPLIIKYFSCLGASRIQCTYTWGSHTVS